MLGLRQEVSLPLFSFNTVVDMDMALFKLVLLEYRNDNVFDMDKISKMTYIDILHDIYYRSEKNLLRLFIKDDKYIDFIDECYNEFTTVYKNQIYKYAVTTEILNLISLFNSNSDIMPSIFYYNEEEKAILDSIPALDKIDKVTIEETKENIYSSIYFRYVEEFEPFKYLTGKTFYFSTTGTNFISDGELLNIEDDEIRRLTFDQCKISIFDMYRVDVIGR